MEPSDCIFSDAICYRSTRVLQASIVLSLLSSLLYLSCHPSPVLPHLAFCLSSICFFSLRFNLFSTFDGLFFSASLLCNTLLLMFRPTVCAYITQMTLGTLYRRHRCKDMCDRKILSCPFKDHYRCHRARTLKIHRNRTFVS